MIKVIIVSPHQENFSEFSAALARQEDVALDHLTSGAQVLELAADSPVDLVVTDEALDDMTGLKMANELVRLNPMINCACVSRLSEEAFHEASEGLGLMPRLSLNPGKAEAEALLSTIRQLKGEL
ncbi:MAG: response regulator [Deltaproteobacteria bacterium]